jgi:PAS domain S-box-containing protein
MADSPFRVLIIDDTVSIHDDFAKVLAPPPVNAAVDDLANALFGTSATTVHAPIFELEFATQGQAAVALVERARDEQRPFAVAFVDMRMPPGWDGLETISHLWAIDPDVQIVICTAYSDHSWASITERLGRSHSLLVLKKPFDHIEALQHAHALATKWSITRHHRAHLAQLDDLVTQRTSQWRAAEVRFSEAFTASPLAQAIVALDRFEILEANEALEKQFFLSAEDLRALTPETFGHGVDPAKWRGLLELLGRGEVVYEHAFVFQPPAPMPARHFRASARAIRVDGRPASIWILRDVTPQVEADQELRQPEKIETIG